MSVALRSISLLLALALSACSPVVVTDETASRESAIVDGAVESGRDSVVLLFSSVGAMCTASIVAPRVVLTAKHCIQKQGQAAAADAKGFTVYVGSSFRQATHSYRVKEVIPAPGGWNIGFSAVDVALVILDEDAMEPAMEMSFDAPESLTGQTFTAVGYGQTPDQTVAVKHSVRKKVQNVRNGLIFVEPAVCQGDSGGPIIGADGRIYGVASFIYSPDGQSQPECGAAPGAYNTIVNQREFIEQAMRDTGVCVPRAVASCNGEDDNCDGIVDDGCTPPGEACESSDECAGGIDCLDAGNGRVCTTRCDVLDPTGTCGDGLFCKRTGGCEGVCVAGSKGAKANGETCEADTECASLSCADPGDGVSRCLSACQGGQGMCFGGEVCVAGVGACGVCFDAERVDAPRGLGEPCDDDMACASGVCLDDLGSRYCTAACEASSDCPASFHCRTGQCVRGVPAAAGEPCVANEDCEGGICATSGDTSFCTSTCSGDSACPSGFACTSVGDVSVCTPGAGLPGDGCESEKDCSSGLCQAFGGDSVCTRTCSAAAPCGPGFECRRSTDAMTGACEPVAAPKKESGGCAVSPAGQGGDQLLVGLLTLLGLAVVRRQRVRA